jgi:hypothetical protein
MTSESPLQLQQQSAQDTMPPPTSMPIKPMDSLYSSMRKPSYLTSQPNSLHSFMANRSSLSSLSAVRSAFLDMEKRRQVGAKAVNFDTDYGYGNDTVQEPPSKKRRFQRRNSKTPAMLMSMSASLVQLEFLDEEKKEEEERQKKLTKVDTSEDDDDDNWDGGLEIAEELVKHLQQRRRSSTVSSSGAF